MMKNSTILILTTLIVSIAVSFNVLEKKNLQVISPNLSNSMKTVEVVAEIDTTEATYLLSIEIFGGSDDWVYEVSVDNGNEYQRVKQNCKINFALSKVETHNVEINNIPFVSDYYTVRVANLFLGGVEGDSSNLLGIKHCSYNGSIFSKKFTDRVRSFTFRESFASNLTL